MSRSNNVEDIYSLSPLQQGLLFHSLYAPDSGEYVEQLYCRLKGNLDVKTFKAAWQSVLDRHSALRTGFYWERREAPLQVVFRSAEPKWREEDWSDYEAQEIEERLDHYLIGDAKEGFILSKAPLMRMALFRIEPGSWIFAWSWHHLLIDGWSCGLVLKEVLLAYQAGCNQAVPALDVTRPYKHYIGWLRKQNMDDARRYWQDLLKGFVTPTCFPTDKGTGSNGKARGYGKEFIFLSEHLTANLQRVAQQYGLTMNSVAQGAWAILLSRYTGDDDVVFGTVVSGRPPGLPGIDTMVGLFINTLPVRVRILGEERINDFLHRLQEEQARARQYEYAPLIEIQGWSEVARGTPLFETAVVFENYPVSEAVAGPNGQPANDVLVDDVETRDRNNFPIALTFEPGPQLRVGSYFDAARFDRSMIAGMLHHLDRLLQMIEQNPEACVGALSLITEIERRRLVEELNQTNSAYPSDSTIVEVFESIATGEPEAVAIVYDKDVLTYGELDRRSNQLARALIRGGFQPEAIAGIFTGRCPEMIIAMLGALKAGGSYLPLDPAYPPDRIAYMIEDSGLQALIIQKRYSDRIFPTLSSIIEIDSDWERIAAEEPGPIGRCTVSDSIAYVIYTSGSTGRPKGIQVTHRGVLRLVINTDYVDFEPGDVLGQMSTASFDAATFEIWGALLNGCTLVGLSRDVALSPDELRLQIERGRITTMFITTALVHQIAVEDPATFSALKNLLVGGETADAARFKQILDANDAGRFLHVYGPTEGTTFSTWGLIEKIEEEETAVPIGKPIANTGVYVVDRFFQPAPAGVAGQLCISGDGLARGYLARPDLTAERFTPNPFSASPGERLYCTGDLVKFLSDGDIEFIGRIDHQVKLRGFRIELGEIETVLRELPGVRNAAAVVKESSLVAYVAVDPPATVQFLSAELGKRLPEFMRPSTIVLLQELPLSPSGKVDKRALPSPDRLRPEPAERFREDPYQDLIGEIWADVLGVERVFPSDNFFELGGHSLLAIRIASRIKEAFGIQLPVRTVFDQPELSGLAQVVARTTRDSSSISAPAIERADRDGLLPLSFAQQRLWFIHAMEPESSAYNVHGSLRLRGDLNAGALRRCLTEIVRRHESLRTTFRMIDGEPAQIIHEAGDYDFPAVDLSSLAEPDKEAEAQRLANLHAGVPFDLEKSAVIATILLRLSGDDHALLVTMHHIVCDAVSLEVLIREIGVLYRAYAEGSPSPLIDLPLQYADFAVWQRQWLSGDVLNQQIDYWRRRLEGAPELHDLPTDRPRPAVQTHSGASINRALGDELSTAIRLLSRREGASAFMTLLAGFQTLMHRYSGQNDILTGTPIAGRSRPELDSLIGFFANTLVIRTGFDGDPAFKEVIGRVRDNALSAYAHQDVQFEKLVEALNPVRTMSHTPVFQVVFSLQHWREPFDLPGLTLDEIETETSTAQFDITVRMVEIGDQLSAEFEYDTDLFDQETMISMFNRFETLLSVVVIRPELRVSEIPLLSDTERSQLLVDWNLTAAPYERDASIVQLFETQAKATPAAVALVSGGDSITYFELNSRANRIANHLISLGVGPDATVGVCIERGIELITALLGILKSGGAYVPLDPEYPLDRLAYILNDSMPGVLVAQEKTIDKLPAHWGQLVCIDSEWEQIAAFSDENPRSRINGDSLAYVVYTSGSTGTPKGVAAIHRGVVRLVAGTNYADLDNEVFLQLATASFDASTFEIWGSLLNGGRLALMPPGQATLEDIGRAIERYQVTILFITSALFQQMVEHQISALARIGQLLTGGEVMPMDQVRMLVEQAPECRLANVYGPTENTTFTSYYPVMIDDCNLAAMPIGSPISNTKMFALDERLDLAGVGLRGELFTAGDGLARGYLGQVELTAEKFLPDPFSGEPGARMYRTGDIVRYLREGALDFNGRRDHQIKIRGYRVELGEIEMVLSQHPHVRECVVTARSNEVGDKRVVGYVVAAQTGVNTADLRQYLRQRLPEYMVPSAIVEMETLPMTPTGKIDRKSLPEVTEREWRTKEDWDEPLSACEQVLAEIWTSVLQIEHVGIDDSFFDLGGHSLLAIKVLSRVRERLEVELSVAELFKNPTIRALAQTLQEEAKKGRWKEGSRPSIDRTKPVPVSYAQRRLWFLDKLEPGSPFYNLPLAISIEGNLNAGLLEKAFREIVRRHETLRTRFGQLDGSPVQIIDSPGDWTLPLVDLAGLTADKKNEETNRLVTEDAELPFDLEKGPLMRPAVLRLAEEEHILTITMHHIVTDAWSYEILLRELSVLYRAYSDGKESPLADLKIQYAEFAAWQQEWLEGELMEREVEHWRGKLGGRLPVLELPSDKPRPPVMTHRGAMFEFEIGEEVTERLNRLSRAEGVTLFMTLLAGFKGLLHRYSGQEDIIVGTPMTGRTSTETEDLIGFFINMLVLRTGLTGNLTFRQLIKRVRQVSLEAFAHQDAPFEKLVEIIKPERDLSHTPLFQVAFSHQIVQPAELLLGDVKLSTIEQEGTVSKFDLSILSNEDANGIVWAVEYNTDIFEVSSIERMMNHYRNLLAGIAETPECRLSEMMILSPEERRQILYDWNDNAYEVDSEICAYQLFERQAGITPDALAVVCGDNNLTYEQLNRRANRLAHHLKSLGIGPESKVAVMLDRSAAMIWTVHGISKAGGAYVPIDIDWPAERIQLILEMLRVTCAVTNYSRLRLIHEVQWNLPLLTDVICVDVEEPEPAAEAVDAGSVRALFDHISERAVDRVSAGGFISAYTGKHFKEAEVDEYVGRVVGLAEPYLGADKRVLEIGCGSGLIMFELAGRVERYVGLDASELTQNKNRAYAEQHGIGNIELVTGLAESIDNFESESFDLIVIASTAQFFPGPIYCRQVLRRALALLRPGGAILVADVLDSRKKEEFKRSLLEYKQTNPDAKTKQQLDELYFDEDFFGDFAAHSSEAVNVDVFHREHGFANELGFRYDVILERCEADTQPQPAIKNLWTGWHLAQAAADNPDRVACSDNTAYVIFTSGSTGLPKGVIVKHNAVVNIVDWVNRTYRVGPGDRVLFVTSLCFDLSVYDIFGVLGTGAALQVASRSDLQQPERLIQMLFDYPITIWNSAPPSMQRLVPFFPSPDALSTKPALRIVFLSGDWIPLTLPGNVRNVFGPVEIVNYGGATEATVWANYFEITEVEPQWNNIPYGKPFQNIQYHTLDSSLSPVPIGVVGDQYIAGRCLAVGYTDVELTAQKFIPNPFSEAPGARMYRTGDQGRYWVDGTMELLGRVDHQLKIRGFRIELGEIEAALSQHPGIRESCVIPREDTPGDKRLVAYVVPESEPAPTVSQLRVFLSEKVPGYMVPAAFVTLAAMPLTSNGKVNRRELPSPDAARPEQDAVYAAPVNHFERLVVSIWEEVLSVEKVGRYDNFFDIGGHSLLATRVMSWIRDAFKVELTVRALFESPTVASLAAAIEQTMRSGSELNAPPIEPVSREQELPLSFAQQRLWFIDQLDPGNPAYNLAQSLLLEGALDIDALARSLNEIFRRHESLRTVFSTVGGRPVQTIRDVSPVELPVIDLSTLDEKTRDLEAHSLVAKDARHSFSLAEGPLLRFSLIRLGPDVHFAIFNMHHIVSDAWSLELMVRELVILYEAFSNGQPSPLTDLDIQYADYSVWQRNWLQGDVLESQLAYWRDQLAGAPRKLELPTDRPRPPVQTYNGAIYETTIPADLALSLNVLSRREGVTLFMTLVAGLQAVLSRYSGQEDVSVGSAIAGRNRSETESLIGFFINTLVLRTDLSGDPTVNTLLSRIREVALGAYVHQDVPFEKLVEELDPERDMSHTPLFQVALSHQNVPPAELVLGDVKLSTIEQEGTVSKFDLSILSVESADGIFWAVEYNTDLFEETSIERMMNHYRNLLAGIAESADRRLSDITMLSPEERRQILFDWNDTDYEVDSTSCVYDLFAGQVERTPDALAVVCGENKLTYEQLNRRANRLAHHLRSLGVGPESKVAVMLDRSAAMIWTVHGISKAGGAYVPIDIDWPAERIQLILELLRITCAVTNYSRLRLIHEVQWNLPLLTDVICVDVDEPEPAAEAVDGGSVRALFDHISEQAVDRVSAGGFISAYTGEHFSEAEVGEYAGRVVSLAEPYLGLDKRVLEIGCGSGLIMFEMAARVERYVGLDPSGVTQNKNRAYAEQNSILNVELVTGLAENLDDIKMESFDLVIIASTAQFFPGPIYFRQALKRALALLRPGGAIIVADVLDSRRKEEFKRSLLEYKQAHPDAITKQQLDELYFDEDFFGDFATRSREAVRINVLHRENGFSNELGFRYDVIIEKVQGESRPQAPMKKSLWTGWHLAQAPGDNPAPSACSDNSAYVIFTSGSTGLPKGVIISHKAVLNILDWVNRTYRVGPGDRVLFVTSLCFDLSVYDIFGILGTGAALQVASRSDLQQPERLVQMLLEDPITIWNSAPPSLQRLVPFFPSADAVLRKPALRLVLLSGDWIPLTLPGNVRNVFGPVQMVNFGGATEATVWANYFEIGEVDPRWSSIPYGKPFQNIQYHTLDSTLSPSPVGVVGDQYIAGRCLAVGYTDPELTAQKFIPNPFSEVAGARMYRTGDRGRYWVDGTMEFLGRVDHQLKIRGFRIELGEIEAALSQHPGIREACVIPREDTPGDKRLVAYVVPESEPPPTVSQLRGFLSGKVPGYMAPAAFVNLAAMPLNSNGKVDRRALPSPDGARPELDSVYLAPVNQFERLIVGVWQEVLNLEKVGRYDNFFDLGGQSILLAQVYSKLCSATGQQLSIIEMFRYPTVAALAGYLSKEVEADAPAEQSASVEQGETRGSSRRDAIREMTHGRRQRA